MGKNRPHVIALTFMLHWLQETFGRHFVNAEAPIDVSPGDNIWNEPEPDLIVLKRNAQPLTPTRNRRISLSWLKLRTAH